MTATTYFLVGFSTRSTADARDEQGILKVAIVSCPIFKNLSKLRKISISSRSMYSGPECLCRSAGRPRYLVNRTRIIGPFRELLTVVDNGRRD